MVEEGRPRLERARHARDVYFDEDVVGKVGAGIHEEGPVEEILAVGEAVEILDESHRVLPGHRVAEGAGIDPGFLLLSEEAEVLYKCTEFYSPENERTIRWNDPELAIDWPIDNPILSEKDANAPFFKDAELAR